MARAAARTSTGTERAEGGRIAAASDESGTSQASRATESEEGFRRYERMSRDEPPTHVTRTVLDANGNAVSGATVFVRERQNLLDSRLRSFRDSVHPVPLVTDGNGRFSVPHVAGLIYDVTVVAEGFAMASTRLYGSASESLILSSPSRLAGVVSRAWDGSPVESALVVLSKGGVDRSAWTDKSGAYEINGLEGGTYLVAVSHPGFQPVRGTVLIGVFGSLYQRDFGLLPGLPLSGFVQDEAGTRIEGAAITLYEPLRQLLVGTTMSDASGAFAFAGLQAGSTYEVTASAQGREARQTFTVPGTGVVETITLTLPAAWILVGQVVDDEGPGLAEATVTVGDLAGGSGGLRSFTTDSEGGFVVPDLLEGRTYVVSAFAPGRERRTVTGISRTTHEGSILVLVLGEGSQINGRCMSAGQGVAGALVRCTPADGHGGALDTVYTFADATGRFHLDGLSVGDVRLTILAAGFVPKQLDVPIQMPSSLDLGDIDLSPTSGSRR